MAVWPWALNKLMDVPCTNDQISIGWKSITCDVMAAYSVRAAHSIRR